MGQGPNELESKVFIGGGGEGYSDPQGLALKYANRHGLIAGATGTGKTVTLQILAEGFSAAGVPVFLSDVKGDLSGLRTGRANTSLLDPVQVEVYGAMMPLNQVATVNAPEPRMLAAPTRHRSIGDVAFCMLGVVDA